MIHSFDFKMLTVAILLSLGPVLALAKGPSGSGGGDLCENRIKIVRDDIENWILKGGAKGL